MTINKINKRLKMNLQMFAEGEPTPPGTPPTPPAEAPKAFEGTQTDVNNIVAKESAKAAEKAKAELIKSFGYEKPEDLQASLKSFKEFQDSQKSDLEKLQGSVGEKDKTITTLQSELNTMKEQQVVFQSGADPSKISQVLALANTVEGADLKAKVAEVLKSFPSLKSGAAAPETPPTPTPPANRRYTARSNATAVPPTTEAVAARAAIRKAAGLKD